jgi:hypothetical protein
MHRLLTAATATAICIASNVASAQVPEESKSDLGALFDAARQARIDRDFATCHDKAEEAWQIDRQTRFAALSGDCALSVGKPLVAERRLRFFVDNRPEGTPEAFMQHVRARLSEARRQLGSIVVTVRPEGATAWVDEEEIAPAAPHFVLPGAHTVSARAESHNPAQRKVEVMRGQQVPVELFLSPIEAVVVTGADDPEGGTSFGAMPLWPAFIAGGVGIVAIAVGAGLIGASAGAASDADDQLAAQRAAAGHDSPCNEPGRAAPCAEIAALRGDEESLHNAGVGVIVFGSVIVAGAAAYAVGSVVLGGDEGDRAALVAPWAGPEGAGLTVRGRF